MDHSARIQAVQKETNPLYYDTILSFYEATGCPMIVDTSFRPPGGADSLTTGDVYRRFMCTEIIVLILEAFGLENSEWLLVEEGDPRRDKFTLD